MKLNCRHIIYDLNKVLPGSLKNNCQAFKIENSKKDFDHDLI